MKKIMTIAAVLLSIWACQSNKKVNLDFGQVIVKEDCLVLPIRKEAGKHAPEWTIELSFQDKYAVLKSPYLLNTCYLSFAFESNGHNDLTTADLDFYTMEGKKYVYALPYTWFPPKAVVEKVIQTGVYYVPENAPIPMMEGNDPDGNKYTYPDFSGYFFVFNQQESQEYFKALIQHLK